MHKITDKSEMFIITTATFYTSLINDNYSFEYGPITALNL